MTKVDVCDLCGRILDPKYIRMEGLAFLVRSGIPQITSVKVINLRRPKDDQALCNGCADVLDKCLTFAGLPHRYDQYERKFYIGLELEERMDTIDCSITSGPDSD